ncbi:hypothetical protein [Pseudoneobacillus sp. C159]
MELNQIASFVVRFQLAGVNENPDKKQWRIKVTHVQDEVEHLFDSIEEACLFMQNLAENS